MAINRCVVFIHIYLTSVTEVNYTIFKLIQCKEVLLNIEKRDKRETISYIKSSYEIKCFLHLFVFTL